MRPWVTVTALAVVLAAARLEAADGDWPNWRGPDAQGVSKETGLLKSWPEGGPRLAWEMDLPGGNSHASVILVGGHLLTMSNTNHQGASIVCMDRSTRKMVWAALTTGNGPSNSTPTYSDGLVYGIGRDGKLHCVNAETGKELWRKHLQQDLGGGKTPGWQFAESPLVDGDRVIVTPGGEDAVLAALNKKTGAVIWKTALPPGLRGKDVHPQYSTIVAAQVGGVRYYMTFIYSLGLVGVDAHTGRFMWNYPRIFNGTANVSTPVAAGEFVFCSTAYQTGAALLKLDGPAAREVYFMPADQFQSHHGGFVRIGDYIYGGSGHNAGDPTCIEWKTGRVMWRQQQLGKGSGSVVAADGRLYFLWEDGTVGLIEARPDAYRLAGQFQLPGQDGPAWAHPVVAGGKLYLRWAAKVFCYDVKAG